MAADETRSCPYCKEEIKADAVRCKHCRSSLAPEQAPHGGTCPYCKEAIHPEAVKCKHCGSALGPKAGCEGCGGSPQVADPALSLMALRAGGAGGIGGTGVLDCGTKLMLCRAGCSTKYGPLTGNNPLMEQACKESCDAAYRLCNSLGGVGGGIFIA